MLDKQQLDALLSVDTLSDLTTAIKKSCLFITPNTRLASQLRELLNAIYYYYLNDEAGCWETPQVMPFDAWFQSLWNTAVLSSIVEPKLLLSSPQDLHYWEQSLEGTAALESLLSKHSAAVQAQQAYLLLNQSLIPCNEHKLVFESQIDSASFYQWMVRYESLIDQTDYCAQSTAQCRLLDAMRSQKDALISDDNHFDFLPSAIALVGFTAPNALQSAILNEVSDVMHIALTGRHKTAEARLYIDFLGELTAAAQWAQSIQAEQPHARIAVVVQDLAKNKLSVDRIFSQQFQVGRQSSSSQWNTHGYNVSAGEALAQVDIVKQALLLLATAAKPLSLDDWVCLLRSPYIAGDEEQTGTKIKLIQRLYETGESQFTLAQITTIIRTANNLKPMNASGCFLSALLAANTERADVYRHKPQCASQWCLAFASYLSLFEWPGSRSLSSHEFQQISVFKAAFNSFSNSDAVLSLLSFTDALGYFQRYCQQQVFQAETVVDQALAPVQVLGGLEASGQVFDYLWLVGMSDEQWPSKPHAHPLIPISLQLEYNMPNSSVAREFEYAQRMTKAYLSSAQHIVLSLPSTIDAVDAKLSPLFFLSAQQLSISIATVAVSESTCLTDNNNGNSEFEFLVDDVGLPITPTVSHNGLLGGSALLKDHHANPLKAYFRWRLGVKPLEPSIQGISLLERGNALHSSLEKIWNQLAGSLQLHSSTKQFVHALVEESVDRAVNQVLSRRFLLPSPSLVKLEKLRIRQSLLTWLTLEANRPNFTVKECEFSFSYFYGQHQIKLRIDRIDQLEDGQLFLIDYKSGQATAVGWSNTYLSEPQLPLYACALDALASEPGVSSSAVAFARVKAGAEQTFVGLAAEDSEAALSIEGVKESTLPSWQAQLITWQSQIDQSIEELINGQVLLNVNAIHQIDAVYESAMRLSSCHFTRDKNNIDPLSTHAIRSSFSEQGDN